MARLLGVDLPRNKAMRVALRAIYGVGAKVAVDVLNAASIDLNKNSNEVTEEDIKIIRQVLESYTVEGDLRREIAMNIKRLRDLGCYRGVRHKKGLPVRGQRTHTNARTRKGVITNVASVGIRVGSANRGLAGWRSPNGFVANFCDFREALVDFVPTGFEILDDDLGLGGTWEDRKKQAS